jgi:hypothetical protein
MENPRPIDVANAEIRNLKQELMKMRSKMVLLESQLKPVREDYLKKKADEQEKDKECVVVQNNSGWWW